MICNSSLVWRNSMLMYSRFKTRENVLSYMLRAKSIVTNGALKSSEIQILKESNQCKTVYFSNP